MAIQALQIQTNQLLSGKFNDIGDLGRALGWDMAFRQLNPGPQSIPTRVVSGAHVALLRMDHNRGYHQCAYPPAGTITFGIPEKGTEDWFGAPYPDQSILPFNQASGIDVVSRPGFLAYTLSFEEEFLRNVSETFQLPLADILYAPSSGAFISDSPAVQDLRALIRSFFGENQTLLDSEQETALAIELLRAGSGETAIVDSGSLVARSKAVTQALDYIEQCQEEVVTIGELCAATDIPWRTLTRAFHERFGLGPKAYLNRLRLTYVRTQLSTSNGKVVIADIANSQGFWHMGQFARDYRIMYGELPSETLNRSTVCFNAQECTLANLSQV